ncbi:MAG: SIS domain-containing protein [Candidatus Marinimicrobia bacterium]|nr:SIS domain-containing protein [Candidatus Neomarinimicrobiota bacterium]MCF7922119.1 SIS domain-containing protein [Candidatus Neomarinimicrobiota bacterium]
MSNSRYFKSYKSRLINLIENIDDSVLDEIIAAMEKTIPAKSKIYVIGNGGSSATASHMMNDFGVGLRRRKIRNFNILSLGDNTPVLTAAANDLGYDSIFSIQLEGQLNKDDVIIAISCSGNSPNIVKAVEYAKQMGSTIIGLTGFHGGKLKEMSDINFHVDVDNHEYGLVEDLHMILDHIIYTYYIEVIGSQHD